MANSINTQSLTQLITEFRKLNAKDAITPESLGAIMQRITDLLATAGTSETTTLMANWYNAMRNAAMYISNIKQSNVADRNDLYLHVDKVSPLGDTTSSNNVGIKLAQATTEHSGVMRAQQVTDLNTVRNRMNDTVLPTLQKLEKLIAELTGTSDSVATLQGKGQIAVEVVNGDLCVYGAGKLQQAGYVPYLFRHTRRRNRDRVNKNKQYGPPTKGWHLYGSWQTVKVTGTKLHFSTNEPKSIHKQANSFSLDVNDLIRIHVDKQGHKRIAWGRSMICLYDKRAKQERMVRLRFAVGFAKKVYHGKAIVNVLNLVSNLAEFSVVYDPKSGKFSISR